MITGLATQASLQLFPSGESKLIAFLNQVRLLRVPNIECLKLALQVSHRNDPEARQMAQQSESSITDQDAYEQSFNYCLACTSSTLD